MAKSDRFKIFTKNFRVTKNNPINEDPYLNLGFSIRDYHPEKIGMLGVTAKEAIANLLASKTIKKENKNER